MIFIIIQQLFCTHMVTINTWTRLYISDCLPEINTFGYDVFLSTNNQTQNFTTYPIIEEISGSRTTYSCWPGYTHVSGDLQRDCLSSLVWGGQRPTCVPVCDAAYLQSCKYCRAVVSDQPHCSIINQTNNMSNDTCHNQQALFPEYSFYYDGLDCLFSNCRFDIKGVIREDEFLTWFSCSNRKY